MLEMMRAMKVRLDTIEEDRRKGLNPRPNDERDDDEVQAADRAEETFEEEE